MSSQTWQELPQSLLDPVMDGALTLAEAAEIFDLILMAQSDWIDLPTHLNPAADRLELWQLEVSPTRH